MLFNSFQFAVFFAVVLLLHRKLPKQYRNGLLLGSSLVFYSLWIPAYLLLLLADAFVNYALLRAMVRSTRPRLYLAASVVFTLGLLGTFKYAALAIETVAPVLRAGFGFDPPIPDFFLPLGISFYSFQLLGLAIDVYRREIEPPASFARYTLFVSFFPQLIAGPILRGAEFLPQLARGAEPTAARTRRGLWLLASGIAKKVIIADYLLASFVDDVFSFPGLGSQPFHWIAAYSFAFQIYFDFSGYTDMARGLGLLLGFELPANFLEPYLSRNPSEFWRRWHITLSAWLRDYLYIPLGGNRSGNARTYINLFLTMLIGGLWHGAAWNFVIWGGLHGLFLMVHRAFSRSEDGDRPLSARDILPIFLTFQVTTLIWVFFRAGTFQDATLFLEAMLLGTGETGWPLFQTLIVAFCILLHVAERLVRARLPAIQQRLATPWWGAALEGTALGAIVGLAIAVSGAGGEFIYFQF